MGCFVSGESIRSCNEGIVMLVGGGKILQSQKNLVVGEGRQKACYSSLVC